MARIETRDEESPLSAPPVGPPRRDDDLDDWFTRRLAAQGIRAGRTGFPLARVVSVIALVVAVVALFWVLSSASGGSSNAATTTQGTHQTTPTTSTGGGTTSSTSQTPVYQWDQVKVTVLNGNGQAGAAGSAQTQLEASGWNIVGTGDTTAPAASTIVVYPPHKKLQAEAVATKLGLPAPVAASTVSGIPTDLSTVAVVLGPNNLPTTG